MTINLKSRVAAGEMVGRVGADIDGVDLSGTYGQLVSVKAHGALGDGVRVANAAITSGAAVLTSASNPFTPAHVGKTVIVDGAGASGVALTTTILSYTNAGSVTLAANASTTVSGAVATIGTDDTDAIEDAVAAAMGTLVAPAGAVLFPASDWYIYTGTGIPADQRVALIGIDRGVSRVVLGTGCRLVNCAEFVDRFTMRDLTVWGGAGAYRSTSTSAHVAGYRIFERNDFRKFTECAISAESADSPYWNIERNVFSGHNSLSTIGVALPADPSGTVIRSNAFEQLRIGIKARQAGLQTVIDSNSFVAFDAGDSGSPRAKVWLVPHTSATNGGNGCRLVNNKYGNENIQDWDYHVLLADEGSGSTNATKMPVPGSASTGHVVGLSVDGNRFSGGGTARADVFSTTPNVNVNVGGNEHDGTAPSYVLEFLSGVTPASSSVLNVASQTLAGIAPANAVIGTIGPVLDPHGWGLVLTCDPIEAELSLLTIGAANRAVYYRVRGGGRVSKIGLEVGTSSGNISVAVYRNTGYGRAAVPGTRLATSGAVACPAAGYQEVSLGSTVVVNAGDWIGLSVDNNTATFASANAGLAATDLAKGRCYYQETAHPLPSSPTPAAGVVRGFVLLGVT